MKIRITDLLDTYYDDSVTLDVPAAADTKKNITSLSPKKSRRFSMQKPLLIAAALMLVLCGGAVLGLELTQNNAGVSLTQGEVEGSAISSEWTKEEPAKPEPDDLQIANQEPESAKETETENTALTEDEHIIYVATLNIPIEPAEGLLTDYGDYITELVIDPTEGTYTWYYHLPALEALLWSTAPEGDYSQTHQNEEFMNEDTAWYNFLLERYFVNAELTFSDGTILAMGSGEAVGFSDSQFWQVGSLSALEEESGVTLGAGVPEQVMLEGSSFHFETQTVRTEQQETNFPTKIDVISEYGMAVDELTLYVAGGSGDAPTTHFTTEQQIAFSMNILCNPTEEEKNVEMSYEICDSNESVIISHSSLHTWPGDWTTIGSENTLPEIISTPGAYTLTIYLNGQPVAWESILVTEPGISHAPAVDVNEDGKLTAILNEDISLDAQIGTIVKFEIDLNKGTCTWYTIMEELELIYAAYEAETIEWDEYNGRATEWSNYLLSDYYGPSRIVFTDGCEGTLGCGDRIVHEDGMRLEDFYIDLGDISDNSSKGYYPAHLIFNGQVYDFE